MIFIHLRSKFLQSVIPTSFLDSRILVAKAEGARRPDRLPRSFQRSCDIAALLVKNPLPMLMGIVIQSVLDDELGSFKSYFLR